MSLREAKKAAEFWTSAEDFARWLSMEFPDQCLGRLGLAVFTRRNWIEFTYRGRGDVPSVSACERTFERWKQRSAHPREFLARKDKLGPIDHDAVLAIAGQLEMGAYAYVARTAGLDAKVQDAIARREDLRRESGRPSRDAGRKGADSRQVRAVQIRLAMLEHKYVLKKAALPLGVSPPKLRKEIREHGLTEVEARIRRPGQRPRTITREDLIEVRDEGLSLQAAADRLGVSKSGVKKAFAVLGMDRTRSTHPGEHSMSKAELAALLADAKERGINKSELASTLGISYTAWRRLAGEHGLQDEWEALQTTKHRGKGEVLDKALTKGILEVAVELKMSANAAAKKYGFANATVLSKAAERHGLQDLYRAVATGDYSVENRATA